MPLRLFFIVCFGLACAKARADFTLSMGMPELVVEAGKQGLCNKRTSAALCRHLPWAPRNHEGVLEVGAAAYVFLDETPEPNTSLAKWLPKFAPAKRLEYYAYFATLSPAFAEALANTPYSVVYVIITTAKGETYVPTAVWMGGRDAIIRDSQKHAALVAELDSVSSEWIPPDDFAPTHQFKAVE